MSVVDPIPTRGNVYLIFLFSRSGDKGFPLLTRARR